jgi:hypothetical protein
MLGEVLSRFFFYFCIKKIVMATRKSLELLEPILIETFGLERLRPPQPELTDWLSSTGSINHEEQYMLDKVLIKLIDNADSWNEEELKMSFISIIILIADFENPIRTYYDREISAEINGIYLSSKVDMMLSKGIGELIKTPYFFLHEYKREKKYSGDPIGQMLGGMLIGQAKNNNDNRNPDQSVYGCYVQGRYWFFSTMIGNQYVISQGFDASKIEDVYRIIFILRRLKEIIAQRIND